MPLSNVDHQTEAGLLLTYKGTWDNAFVTFSLLPFAYMDHVYTSEKPRRIIAKISSLS